MENIKDSRLLTILAVILLFVLSLSSVFILLIHPEANTDFNESIITADYALKENNFLQMKKALLKASGRAVSSDQWKQILSIAAESTKNNSDISGYKLFTVLAGRASSAIPGNSDFKAFWIWGLLRSGDSTNAGEHLNILRDDKWSSLRAEVRLQLLPGQKEDQNYSDYLKAMDDKNDPEFFSTVSYLTESAELTSDAAYLYMLYANPIKAYELAELVMNNRRRWADKNTVFRFNVPLAMAEIAYDTGNIDSAVKWLEMDTADALRRRTENWEQLKFLGDLYWKKYSNTQNPEYLDMALFNWNYALGILNNGFSENSLPDNSWKIFINIAAGFKSSGRFNQSAEIMDKALSLYPECGEVVSAWARMNYKNEPALSRQILNNFKSVKPVPIIEITRIILSDKNKSPRIYESELWNILSIVIDNPETVEKSDRKIIVSYILNYLVSRRNFNSIDVAIDRYTKKFPDEKWIYSWRLAADASRGYSILDIIPSDSPYLQFRNVAYSTGNWKALHDSALFAYLASRDLKQEISRFKTISASNKESDSSYLEPALLHIVSEYAELLSIAKTPLGDRINILLKNNSEYSKEIKILSSTGKRGQDARRNASASLVNYSDTMLNYAEKDITKSLEIIENLYGTNDKIKSELLYLKALILLEINPEGNADKVSEIAETAIRLDPENTRALELQVKNKR